ncbi:hypothetical protein D9619_008383 [Psilocybe cf. subviscida]|uniref:Uncharacterized protein n=1 Tax=Psilocybe cf. subviscida TaxID=2480587 RepID=A0A8H5F0M9_9AGAR|nr:hypothetical protein D9619_008383 [Psilocybe cf. subviscida]
MVWCCFGSAGRGEHAIFAASVGPPFFFYFVPLEEAKLAAEFSVELLHTAS